MIVSLDYYPDRKPSLASVDDVEQFQRHFPDGLSPPFATFCMSQNGGILKTNNCRLAPNPVHDQNLSMCRQRAIGSSGEIEVNYLFGLSADDEFGITAQTMNTRRVWRLPGQFWVVASDAIGFNLVSRLAADSDEVYMWEPNIAPHVLQVTTSLVEFYNS